MQGATRSARAACATAPDDAYSYRTALNIPHTAQQLASNCLHRVAATYGTDLSNGMLDTHLGMQGAQIVTAGWRQASRSDTSLVPHMGTVCVALSTSQGLDRALRAHLELSMLMVWVANSPPASTRVRGHCFGTCGLGVHWWNEAKRATATTHKQENVRTLPCVEI